MSRANGIIKFEDGYKMYCLYDGTCDMMYSSCYVTQDDAWIMYQEDIFRECVCASKNLEKVIASHDYGTGTSWLGSACRKCMVFIGPTDPYEYY